MNILEQEDPEVWSAVAAEQVRQQEGLELIASENFTSPAVMQAVGSVLTNKYAEGYPGRRYYGGCEFVDKVEDLARERLKSVFGAEHVNVQPHSGSQANAAVYLAAIQPGDTETNWTVVDPEGNESTPVKAGDELNPAIRFDGTWLPGVYEFRRANPGGKVAGAVPQGEVFVVNFDRSESDLEPLADERWGELTAAERLRRINEPAELFSAIKSDSARVEIWQLLLFVFLAILVGDVLMTRRLVQGGHQYGRDTDETVSR